jgi:hypothetical protein
VLHDHIEQAMAPDGGIKARGNRLAIADALRQMRVELRNVVPRGLWRTPGAPGNISPELAVRPTLLPALRALNRQLLTWHRGAGRGGELQIALLPIDLEQSRCSGIIAGVASMPAFNAKNQGSAIRGISAASLMYRCWPPSAMK